MNERIRELLKQSTNPPWDGEQGPMNEFNLERFAELLDKDAEKKYFSAGYIAGQSDSISETVQQCINICISLGDDNSAQYIEKHFGVEE
jgi:hypothetical protein